MANAWEMYDRLVSGVPAGIAVKGFHEGEHWLYVEAECGVGISHMVPGGALGRDGRDPRDLQLHELAAWVKSWNFEDASLGVAALNAWYCNAQRLAACGFDVIGSSGEAYNPFDSLRERYAGKKVVVVGHFPNVEGMADVADLTVLERDCRSPLDTPDPACEYIIPHQDYAFVTGITITNKTAPRLLELARGVPVILTGPSAVPSPILFEYGVDAIAGSIVMDPEPAKEAVRQGGHGLWRRGIGKFTWRCPAGALRPC